MANQITGRGGRPDLRAAWLAMYVPIVTIELLCLIVGALDKTTDGFLRPHDGAYAVGLLTIEFVVFGWLVVNTSLAAVRIANPVNLYLSVGAMLWAAFVLPEPERVASHPEWSATIHVLQWAGGAFLVPHLFWFPDGRFIPRWSWSLALIWLIIWGTTAVTVPGGQGLLTLPPARLGVGLVFVLVGLAAQIRRLHITKNVLVQQQLKWVLYGEFIHYVGALIVLPARFAGDAVPFLLRADITIPIYVLAPAALTAAYNVAIFRYRLWDIDLVVNRTLVYATATAMLATGFFVLSRLAQTVLATVVGVTTSDATTVVIAVVLASLFPWLQRRIRPFVDAFLPSREVLAVLFTDVVGSTQLAATVGDERWRELLAQYRAVVRRDLKRFHGNEVDTAGDGFFATFRSSQQAVRCGLSVTADVADLGVDVRTGIHQGPCEMRGEKVSGLTLHVGARILALASQGEVLVSRAVSDAVADEGIRFDDHGVHTLRGIPEVWPVYSARPSRS